MGEEEEEEREKMPVIDEGIFLLGKKGVVVLRDR